MDVLYTMKENQFLLNLDSDLPGSPLAMAIGISTQNERFLVRNPLFGAVFPGIETPHQLLAQVTSKSDNKTVVTFNDTSWELLEFGINHRETLFLLRNITFEMLALKQLKKQLQELTGTYEIYQQLLGKELPVGILIVSENYDVSFANHTIKGFFRIHAKLNLKKCYNFVGEIKPCEGCILKSVQQDAQKNKKTFVTENGNRLITAEIHRAKDKFIIIFRDTTKEINLIQEIKKQQEELENANRLIAEQNDILKRLSNINVRIGQMRDLEAILEAVITSIIETFQCEKGAILLFNESGKIKNAHFTGEITESERNRIIHSIAGRSVRGSAPATMSRECEIFLLPEDSSGIMAEPGTSLYTVQEMVDKGKLIGCLFLYRPGKVMDRSILELFLMQVNDLLENLELQRKLEEVAQTDGLTGVFNRYYFDKRFAEETELSLRYGQPLSLILTDLNGLKAINDHIGHEAGDLLLGHTARLLSKNIRSADAIYRIGGDEFVILLSNCSRTQLEEVTQRFKEIQENASFALKGETFPIRFSLGGACSTEVEHTRLKDEADKRMYVDKENYYKTQKKYR